MMASKHGKKPALDSPEQLVLWAGTRDPFKIAEKLEIPVIHKNHPESGLPGLTCLMSSRPAIFINDAYFDNLMRKNPHYTEEIMNDDMAQVAAHELGHACLHRKELKTAPIREYQIFDVHTTMEAEANEFAAGIRIDKEELLSLLNSDYTLLQVASAMHVNINLLIYRIEMLRKERHSFHELPYLPKNNFMGHIVGSGSSEWNV